MIGIFCYVIVWNPPKKYVKKTAGISLKDIGFGIFDDNKIFDFLDFPIITAEQPIKQMGTLATKILFDQLAGNPPKEFIHRLPVNIVLR